MPIYIDGFRQWGGGVVDGLRVRADTDALGIRTGRRSPGDPPGLLWERAGDLTEIVGALLVLPAPDQRWAPRLVLGAAPTLWTP
ncbi:hypothetical protein [Goodfellowiella coeruleoviolacea]|uniref:hypothetical protein n=1 Tax=Goodfellowiella coeruleoviolacea TaxID=334858 RepID=UPI0020A4D85F|nr:hypothetical protein [Goodfellowiella coeruleoviolacea]